MFKRFTVLLLCFILLGGILTACTAGRQDVQSEPGPSRPEQSSAPAGEVDVRQEVVAGLGRDPGTMYGYGAHPPLTRVLETLFCNDVELEIAPGLATGWEISDDNLTWTIYLREGVAFHDGTPFNASAAVHNLERLAKNNAATFGPVEAVTEVSEFAVAVTHREPFAPFLYALAWPGAAMISPGAIDDEGKVLEPVGTGPFVRESWTPDQEMVLVANKDYWGGPPQLERVTLKVIPDPTTRMMALEAGEIDLIIDTGGVLPEQVPTLQAHPRVEVLTIDGAVPHYMTLNTANAPFDDLRVRQAVMYAIDPASIIEYTLEGFGKVMTSVIPHSEMDWMHAEPLYLFNNPARAKELLREAGWQSAGEGGMVQKDGEECRVKFLLSSALTGRWPYLSIAEVIQAQLKDVGIRVDIEVVESGLWSETLRKGEAHLSMRPWAGLSPQSRLEAWLHSQGENTINMGTFYHNPQLDGLIGQLMQTTDVREAKKVALQIQEIAAEEVPLIPIYDEVLIGAVRDNIRGYRLHPWFAVNWEEIYVTER